MDSGHDILYLLQDMREFELYGTVRAVISICDSMNYILEEEDLLQVFRLVNNYLDPGGYFIFDLNTIYKYEQIRESTIAENLEEASFIWDNFYDAKTQINEYELAIFIPEGDSVDMILRSYGICWKKQVCGLWQLMMHLPGIRCGRTVKEFM